MSSAVPKSARVKNKNPAPLQITAEQILRESKERLMQQTEIIAPKQKITDAAELADYRMRKRKEFEDYIRRNRYSPNSWLKYAKWEESQLEFERMRSVMERALEVDYRNSAVWTAYAEMEMRNKNVNHARNIWDRAVVLLPRVDQMWLKYAHMEELLGNISGARTVYERWMNWEPDVPSWSAYINLEIRSGQVENARKIYQRLVQVHPTIECFLKWAKFEERNRNTSGARAAYTQAIQVLGEEANDERLYVPFAQFEERAKEYDRARSIYRYALDHLPKQHAQELFSKYTAFEKMHGDRQGIEDVVVGKRRFQYEEKLKLETHDYDTWFDYIRLEESACEEAMEQLEAKKKEEEEEQEAEGAAASEESLALFEELVNKCRERVREVYERAIANVPPVQEKKYWRRYVYLWINYALYEEIAAKNVERAREVYREFLNILPHRVFSFSKAWLLYAQFEIRQKDLAAARKVLGTAIGVAPKDKIFKHYIQTEIQLGEIDRCRQLYQKQLQLFPDTCAAWVRFADLEKTLGEVGRARAIFELAVSQPVLDMPEILWKAYIDFEIAVGEAARARELYERLLNRTKHVKVWISYAMFEASQRHYDRARAVFDRGHTHLRTQGSEARDERVMILENWRDFEAKLGPSEHLQKIRARMPKKIQKRRPIKTEDGVITGYETIFDYIFPDDDKSAPSMKLLEMAHKWKRQKMMEQEGSSAAAASSSAE